jgi:hypothetical protein
MHYSVTSKRSLTSIQFAEQTRTETHTECNEIITKQLSEMITRDEVPHLRICACTATIITVAVHNYPHEILRMPGAIAPTCELPAQIYRRIS